MNVLVLNAGSSSLKFRLFRMDRLRSLTEREDILAGGEIERIGTPQARMTFASGANAPESVVVGAGSVGDAAHAVVSRIAGMDFPCDSGKVIDAIGHRIVHGGPRFSEPALIDDSVLGDVRELSALAPLHNPAGISGIDAARVALPSASNVAVFDTAFHHRLPPVSARYALPAELSDRMHIRRYGFHGISYRYATERFSQIPRGSASSNRLILCHLGNGASVCAVRDGCSVDTSMGFTPMEGLIMGTRSGDVDPGILLHLMRAAGMTVDEIDHLLNRESGLLGLSGRSGDVRDLERFAAEGDAAASFALECFAYRVRKYLGAYAAVLGGVDALIFTAGIGEHSAAMRARICGGLEFLGLHLDETLNRTASASEPAVISSGEGAGIWVVPTDEERQIARETFALLNGNQAAAE